MRLPISTYRLQIRDAFDLHKAAGIADYIRELGADWVYFSPILKAEEGSDHGYDVTDHSRVDDRRGGAEGLATASAAARANGLGVLVDIVPNHVGVATPVQSVWWWDLLTHGRQSRYAEAFDVDWDFGGGKVRIPVLGDPPTGPSTSSGGPPGQASELDELSIVDGELRYYDNRFPIAPGTADDNASATEVHARQNYELMNWRRADAELNYRRFFAVSTLAGIRVEIPWVFDESHREIARWITEGLADGVRVDHPDGLIDPGGYLDSLATATGGCYVLVEKILEGGEQLPTAWAAAGTTGYDALADIDRAVNGLPENSDAATIAAAKCLADAGHEVEEGTLQAGTVDEFIPLYQHTLASVPAGRIEVLQPATRWLVEEGRKVSVAQARRIFSVLRHRVHAWVGDADVIVTPTVFGPPPRVGAWSGLDGEAAFRAAAEYGAFTAVFNLSGQPGASVPVGLSTEGFPVGVQVVGRETRDDWVLAVSRQLEEAFPRVARVAPM